MRWYLCLVHPVAVSTDQLVECTCSEHDEWCSSCADDDSVWCCVDTTLQPGHGRRRTRASLPRCCWLFHAHFCRRGFVGFLQGLGSISFPTWSSFCVEPCILGRAADCMWKFWMDSQNQVMMHWLYFGYGEVLHICILCFCKYLLVMFCCLCLAMICQTKAVVAYKAKPIFISVIRALKCRRCG